MQNFLRSTTIFGLWMGKEIAKCYALDARQSGGTWKPEARDQNEFETGSPRVGLFGDQSTRRIPATALWLPASIGNKTPFTTFMTV